MKLSIIIPACNEELRIGPMLEAYLPYFSERYGKTAEFIVVINGTTDDTEEVVRRYAADHPNLRWITMPEKSGKGGAILEGIPQADGDLIGYVDADGSTPPAAYQELVEQIGDADIVIASRGMQGAVVSPPQPWLRRFVSRVFNLMVRTLFGLKLSDTQCGAKLMKHEAIRKVVPQIGLSCWAFDVDLLFGFKRLGLKIKEVPTTWADVAGSKIVVTESSFEMLLALIRLRLVYSPLNWTVDVYERYFERVLPHHMP